MPTILVADDNSNIQKMVSLVFQEKGMHVVAVGNGEAACRKVPELKPDIVLADVFMPVRNGYEVCEFVKRDSRFSETPVVLLVGAFDPLDEKEARRVGADGVLKKPFVPPEPLISLVGSLLQKSEKPEEVPNPAPAQEPPPVAVAPPPEPPRSYQTEPEPEPQEDQFAYGAVGRESIAVDDETTTERETVTAPLASPEDPQDDITESASDWKRRREAMDYDIPAEDSASLVEHLAEERPQSFAAEEEVSISTEESAARAESYKELQPETPEPSRVSSSEWSSYVPAAGEESTASESHDSNFEDSSSFPSPVTEPEAPEHVESHSSEFESPESRVQLEESASSVPSVIPFPAAEQSPSQEFAIADHSHVEEAIGSEPASVFEAAPAAQSAVEQAVHEAISHPEPSSHAPMDQSTIDSIVAKVVEKLEPQLHQALSQGVLRPLIQELLKGELKPEK